MNPNPQWQPPGAPPLPPAGPGRPGTGKSWLPAAIIGSAIVVAAGLIAGALILKKDDKGADSSTCQSWSETRATLRSIPALPDRWNWNTPGIDTLISLQNAPVQAALDSFEAKIAAKPADVAEAAHGYVEVRRKQGAALSDRSYTPEMGAEVDASLQRLNQLCGIPSDGRPI